MSIPTAKQIKQNQERLHEEKRQADLEKNKAVEEKHSDQDQLIFEKVDKIKFNLFFSYINRFRHIIIDLFGCAADELFRIGDLIDLVHHRSERWMIADQIEKFVLFAMVLHAIACGDRQLTNYFMQFLAITASLYSGHQNVLSRHEWQLGHHVLFDHLWIDNQSVRHLRAEPENRIREHERGR